MPTGSEYRTAAREFRNLAEDAPSQFAPVDHDWDDAVRGCKLATTVGNAVDASRSMFRQIVSGFNDLGKECDRRAAACEEYEHAMVDYKRKVAERERAQTRRDAGEIVDVPDAPTKPDKPTYCTEVK